MRLGDLDALLKLVPSEEIIARMAIINAPTVDDERIERALEAIQTVIENTNGRTDNMAKLMRNTAKFIKYAINGEMPNYENVEGEDCDERLIGEWIKITKTGIVPAEYICSVCGRKIFDNYEHVTPQSVFYPYCHCGAKMNGGAEE